MERHIMMTHLLLLRWTFNSMQLLLLLLFSCGPGWQSWRVIRTVACFEHSPLAPPNHQLLFPSSLWSPSSWIGRKNSSGITSVLTKSKTKSMVMSTMTLTSTSLHTSSTPLNDTTDDHGEDDENDNNLDLNSFQQELARRRRRDSNSDGEDDGNINMNDVDDDAIEDAQDNPTNTEEDNEASFDGYDFRDIIYSKWGECFDVDFQRVDSYGFRNVYLVS